VGGLQAAMKWPHLRCRPRRFSSASCDVTLTSLRALKESADLFPPLKGAVGGVLALWDIVERVKRSKKRARDLRSRAIDVLYALNDAVEDPVHIPLGLRLGVDRFELLLNDICNSMEPLTKPSRRSWLLHMNRDEDMFETFDRRLNEASQCFVIGTVTRIESTLTRQSEKLSDLNKRMTVTFISVALF